VEDRVVFAQQLALLLQTGNSVVPSIAALAKQSRSEAMRKVLDRVHSGLQDGKPLSDCLQRHPDAFGPLSVNLIRAGEATGALQESLAELTRMLQIQRGLRNRIREATTYPLVLIALMVGVLTFMMVFVLPRFAELFEGIEDELPITTRLLLGTGDLLHSRWWLLIPITLLVVIVARWLRNSGAMLRAWDSLKLKIPLVGKLFEEAYMFRLFSSLSLLLSSHVPLLEAIGIARGLVGNSRYNAFFDNLTRQVEGGHGVTPAFQEADFFPDTVKLMVATGESSGAMDKVMGSLSERYREDLESDIRRLSTLLEPALLVVMGALVGLIAVSFIVPIFKMSKAIG
jgi:type II secretory pathway component PulF